MSFQKRGRWQKGAIQACCLFLVIGFVLLVIGGIVFYFAVWKVPDYAKETEAVMIRVENDLARRSGIKDEDNAWTYYSKASDILDLSSLDTAPPPKSMPRGNRNYYPQINEMLKTVSNPPNAEDLKKLEKIYKKNKKVFELTDRAYTKNAFFNELHPLNLVPSSQSQYSKSMEKEMKVQVLGYFLLLSGEITRSQGMADPSARCLMQAIHLGQNYRGQFLGVMSAMSESYSGKAWKSLVSLSSTGGMKRELYQKILGDLPRLKPETARQMLESGLYQSEKMLEGMKSTPNAGNFAFILDREAKISRGMILKLMDEADKDPVHFADGLSYRKPDKFSFYSAIFPKVAGESVKSLFHRQVSYGGVMLNCGLNLYHIDNGAYPKSLDDISPKYISEIPKDPLSETGNFVYKSNDKKTILYSVGENHKDDGGTGDDIILLDTSIKAGKAEKIKPSPAPGEPRIK